jgi:hypothetical protein
MTSRKAFDLHPFALTRIFKMFSQKDSYTFIIAVLRLPNIRHNPKELESALDDLRTTSYQRRAPLEDAPFKTDCLTSIHYIFQKAFNHPLPLDLVGDLPRLLSRSGWTLKLIDSNDLLLGDLIFLKRKSELKRIAHAALVIGPNQVFHCKRDAGATIESIEEVWAVFEQTLKEDLLKYIDPRNTDLRGKHGRYIREKVSSL